jgi:predicted phosphodiesterase
MRISAGGVFHTAPGGFKPFRFVAYGDTRSNPAIHGRVANRILSENPALVIHTGDLITAGCRYDMWGREFFEPAKNLMKSVPVYPCLGNHEGNSHWYFDFFSLPGNERWYSFDYSNAHFIFLDSYSDFRPGSLQNDWLKEDLKSNAAKWTFVCFHAPPYTSGPHGAVDERGMKKEKEMRNAQTYLVPLFEEYEVDMVFNGHDHQYERSRKKGVYYIVAGGGGAPLYGVDSRTPNQYSQIRKSVYHYCVLDVGRHTLDFNVKDTEGNIVDHVRIDK